MQSRILTLLAFIFWAPAAAFPESQPVSSQDFSVWRMYGPHWSTEEGLDTLLLVTNPESRELEIGLQIFSKKGRVLATDRFVLGAAESATISLRELAGLGNSGHLVLTFPTRIPLLPAMALIGDHSDNWVADLVDERFLAHNSRKSVAILPVFASFSLSDAANEKQHQAGRLEQKSYLFITNTGSKKETGSVQLMAGEELFEERWDVEAKSSRRIKIKNRYLRGNEMVAISVASDTESYQLMFSGVSVIDERIYEPLRFRAPIAESSGELVGFVPAQRGARKSMLYVWNHEEAPLEISIASTSLGSPSIAREVPGETAVTVGLDSILPQRSDTGTAVSLGLPEGRRVSGLLVSLGEDDAVSSSLKDTKVESHVGYTLPVRLRSDGTATLGTKLLLHNPNPFQAEFCIFFLHEEDRYTYPKKSIGARQTIEIDLLRAQREGLVGELGNVIPTGPIDGQVKVVFHTESEKKLLAMGVIESRDGQQITTFEECISCPPTLSYVNLSPSLIVGIPAGYGLGSADDEKVFLVEAGWDDGSFKLVNGSALEDIEDEKIAEITSLDRVTLKRIGATTLTADYGDCVQYAPPEMFDPWAGADCACTLTDVLTDQSQVRGTCGGINLPIFLERDDLIPMYQDSFDEGGVQFIPLCTDFTNFSCAFHFTFSEWVSNNSGFLYLEAMMDINICVGLDGVRDEHGGPLILNSGYRSPDHQMVVNPAAPNGRHQYGDAADIRILDWNGDGSRIDDWNRIRGFAKAEAACVEPRSMSGENHVHMDYRPTCPAGW